MGRLGVGKRRKSTPLVYRTPKSRRPGVRTPSSKSLMEALLVNVRTYVKHTQYKTSSSAIGERPRDACSTSNRKPVEVAFVRRKSLDGAIFEGGGSLRSPILGGRGRRPPTTVGWQKTRRIALSCGIKISPVSSLH